MDSSIFGFLIVGFVLLLGIGGLGFYLLYRRSNYKHNFRVWSRDLSSSQVVRAKIEVDKENKSNRVFVSEIILVFLFFVILNIGVKESLNGGLSLMKVANFNI